MADSLVVGILRVLLTANTAEFEQALKDSSKTAKAWSKDLGAIGRSARDAGQTLTTALTLPLVGLGVAVSKAAIDFESSFAGVRKTVEATEGEFQKLAGAFRQLSKSIPVNVNELNRIGEAAGALGIKKEDILDFTKVMAELGVTTNLTSDQAADGIARIQNIFGAAGKETDRFGATLVALGNAGASTESEILELAKRLAGAGAQIGITQAQTLGFASALASVGIEAEAGGTAFSRVFIKLASAVRAGGKDLQAFADVAGMSAAAFKTMFEEDAAGAVLAFVTGLQRMKKAGDDVFGTLGQLELGEIRVRDALLRTSGAAQMVTEQVALSSKAWKDNTALTEEARKRFETTESQLTLLWNRVKDVGITVGNALLPAIRSAIGAIDRLLPIVEDIASAFAALPGGVQVTILAIAGLAAALGPALMFVGQMALGASALVGAFGPAGIATKALGVTMGGLTTVTTATTGALGLLARALTFATGPIGLVVGGLGLLGFAIYKAATAETDLEKSLRQSSDEFKRKTDQLGLALQAYNDLSAKQTRTTQETTDLAAATKALADASGLSVEAFQREQAESKTLTDALTAQLRARKELYQAAIEQARTTALEAAAAVAEAQAQLTRVLSGDALTSSSSGVAGDIRQRKMGVGERIQEVERLNGVIETLQQRADEAKGALDRMLGVSGKDIELVAEGVTRTGGAAKLTAEQIAELEKATRKANEAADAYNASQDATVEKLQSVGAFTQEVAAKALGPYIEKLNLAAAAGDQQLRVALIKLEPEVRDLAAAMRVAGLDTQFISDMLDQLRERANSLPPVIQRVASDVSAAMFRGFRDPIQEAGLILKGLPPLATSSIGAVADAFKTLGITSQLSLQQTAAEARRAYDILKASRIATADELKVAWKRVEETARAAAGETKRSWSEVFPYLKTTVEQIGTAINGTFAQMLLGAKDFKDGFLDIWESIKAGLARIFTEILNDFTNRLLQGMLGALTGKGGFAQAFSGLIPTLFGGAGSAGGIAGVTGNFTVPGLPGGAAAGATPWWSTAAGGGLIGGAAGAGIGFFVGSQTGNVWGGAGAGAGTGAGVGAALGGPIGAGIGAAIGGLVGWWAAKRENIKTNDVRDAFLAQFGAGGTGTGSGFMSLAAKLTEATGEAGGGRLFQQLITANDREAIEKAIAAVNQALAEYESRTKSATEAEKAQSAALEESRAQYEARIAELEQQQANVDKQIADWDAREAPEAVMGAVEAAARAELAQQQQAILNALNAERQAMEEALAATADAGTKAADQTKNSWDDTFAGILAGAQRLAGAFRDAFGNIQVPGIISGGDPDRVYPLGGAIPQFADGTDFSRPPDFGPGTLAMLHRREFIVPEDRVGEFIAKQGGGGSRVTIGTVYLNGQPNEQMKRDLTDYIAQHLPDSIAGGGSKYDRWQRMTRRLATT